eukprot:Colp12_sorted_trinity150504_noHs@28199
MADTGLRARGAAARSKGTTIPDFKDDSKTLILKRSAPYGYAFLPLLALFYGTMMLGHFWANRHFPLPKPFTAPETEFAEGRARVHLDAITSYGVRTVGSFANENLTVEYILKTLETAKKNARPDIDVEIEVQRPTGSFYLDFLEGFTNCYSNVTNVLVRVSGKKAADKKHAILLSGHFDTSLGSPGASDDAVSMAVGLELVNNLVHSEPLPSAIVVNFNGAEETILQAAHGFITQHPWVENLQAFINLEAAGAGGRELVFQTGPDNAWLAHAYAEHAPHPHGNIIGQEIFQSGVIPSDTDFRIYRDYGDLPGIDIAYVANGYVYHTELDTADRIEAGAVQRCGENILEVLRGLARSHLLGDRGDHRQHNAVYFDVLGLYMVSYSDRLGFVVNSVTLVLATFFLLAHRPARLATALARLLLSILAAVGAALLTAAILLLLGGTLRWYSHPYLPTLLFSVPALLGCLAVYQLGARSPALTHDHEENAFAASLCFWFLQLGVANFFHLGSAFLPCQFVLLPLLARLLQQRLAPQSLPARVLALVLGAALPTLLLAGTVSAVLTVFVPIMGRAGTLVPPELIVAVICAASTSLLCVYFVPVFYMLGRP